VNTAPTIKLFTAVILATSQ